MRTEHLTTWFPLGLGEPPLAGLARTCGRTLGGSPPASRRRRDRVWAWLQSLAGRPGAPAPRVGEPAVPAVKSDGGWVPAFRQRYAAWLPEALPLLERHEYARAFSSYPWPAVGESPWAPLRKPLAECRVALVTTAGLYRPGVDAPFDGPAPEGDWTYRRIPVPDGTPVLAIAHEHFPHEPALSDLDTVLPLQRLRELVREGIVGAVVPVVWSLMGYCTRAADLAEETAPAIAQGLRDLDADLALVVPV